MASVADRPFRILAKEFGASYVTSEMIPVKGVCYSKQLAFSLLRITPFERPMALQFFGNDPLYFKKAVEIANSFEPDVIDINMGCPVKKVVSCGAGVALMPEENLAQRIVSASVKAAKCPVTVKFRKGYDDLNVSAVAFAKKMEQAGASALTVHGRTKAQMFGGKNDFEIIKEVKQAVSCPVIASGDIASPEKAKEVYLSTGADLIMIGRGCLGRPFIFSQTDTFLKNGCYKTYTKQERMLIMRRHVNLIIKEYGEQKGMKIARGHITKYLYGLNGAAKFRSIASKLESYSQFEKFFLEILNSLED